MSRLQPEEYFALTYACKHCPFRTDVPNYLNRRRKEDIATSLERGEEFVCHKTVDYSCSDDTDSDSSNHDTQENSRACAGARSVAHKEGVVSQMEQIATRLGFTVAQPQSDNITYGSFKEWINSETKAGDTD